MTAPARIAALIFILLLELFWLTPARADASVVAQFKQAFNDALKDAGRDYGACDFVELREGPDGEGGIATSIEVSCERAPHVCIFLARLNPQTGEPETKPLACRENPLYEARKSELEI